MKKWIAVFLVVAVSAGIVLVPVRSHAGVSVSIKIPLPGLVLGAPPVMAVVPGTYVYAAPEADADLFFYQGYWYRPYNGRWFASVDFNGPWGSIAFNRVPQAVIDLPPAYRRMPSASPRMPYGMVRKNWRNWEEERHWDNYARGGGYAGPPSGYRRGGMGMGMGGR